MATEMPLRHHDGHLRIIQHDPKTMIGERGIQGDIDTPRLKNTQKTYDTVH